MRLNEYLSSTQYFLRINKLLITSLFWTTSSIFKVSSFMASNYERQTQLTQWETIWQHFFSRDWSPKFETGVNIIIGIVQKV